MKILAGKITLESLITDRHCPHPFPGEGFYPTWEAYKLKQKETVE